MTPRLHAERRYHRTASSVLFESAAPFVRDAEFHLHAGIARPPSTSATSGAAAWTVTASHRRRPDQVGLPEQRLVLLRALLLVRRFPARVRPAASTTNGLHDKLRVSR